MWKLSEIWASYERSGRSGSHIQILAELNAVPLDEMMKIITLCEQRYNDGQDINTGNDLHYKLGGYDDMAKKTVFTDEVRTKMEEGIRNNLSRRAIADSVGMDDGNGSFQCVYYKIRRSLKESNKVKPLDIDKIKAKRKTEVEVQASEHEDTHKESADTVVVGEPVNKPDTVIEDSNFEPTFEDITEQETKQEEPAKEPLGIVKESEPEPEEPKGVEANGQELVKEADNIHIPEAVDEINLREAVYNVLEGSKDITTVKKRLSDLVECRADVLKLLDYYNETIAVTKAQLHILQGGSKDE